MDIARKTSPRTWVALAALVATPVVPSAAHAGRVG
jgi:hypothetical protein